LHLISLTNINTIKTITRVEETAKRRIEKRQRYFQQQCWSSTHNPPAVSPQAQVKSYQARFKNAPLGSKVNIIIETKTSDYSNMINYINSIGGEVRHTYKYVNAISASIPEDSLPSLQTSPDVAFIYKDTVAKLAAQPTVNPEGIDKLISQPTTIEGDIQGISIDPDQLLGAELNTYWDPTVSNAAPLWDAGYRGKNTTVAIIDTGIWTGHFMFRRTSIIGGADLSFDNYTIYQQYADIIPWPYNETYEGWDNPYNHWHGSHVAGIIAGRGAILLPENHTLTQAVERYTGTPLPSAEPYGYPGYKILYLFGIAPYANLYIVKVFDHTGSGIPESLVLNAIEHVIDLKLQGVDIDIISMSLGGPTLYDGRDLEDKLVDYATSVGITVVAAAGNDGPARMELGIPIDIQVLNEAPLPSKFHVFTNGKLLYSRNENLRIEKADQALRNYLDLKQLTALISKGCMHTYLYCRRYFQKSCLRRIYFTAEGEKVVEFKAEAIIVVLSSIFVNACISCFLYGCMYYSILQIRWM